MESVAQSIVSKFGQVLVEELKEIRGVGSKVVHLRDELATMNAVLRVISEAEQDKVDHIVREWENQVHDLVYDAKDCTDTYSLRIVRPTPRPAPPIDDVAGNGNQLIFWARYLLAGAKRIARYPYEKLVLQRALAAEIKDLLARTTSVSERRARYNIDRTTLPRAACFAPVSAASISMNSLRRADNPDQFVGITEQANALARKIKAMKPPVHDEDSQIKGSIHGQRDNIKAPIQDEDDMSLKVFSIVGFGGLGKTTLAMELCRQLDADFPCQALVSVSQVFDVEKDMKGLLVRVLKQILKEKPKTNKEHLTRKEKVDDTQTNKEEQAMGQMSVEELSSKMKELLDQKRYFIVIDDVWSLSALEAILISMPKNNCGSRIIVTTRMEAVAKAASVDFVHDMKPLELKASTELFRKRVFGSMATCPNELGKVMDKVLKKCGGLPLAIISIASLLASYRSAEDIEMWERVSRSIGSHMESHPTLGGMRQLITLSYDYLPHHLKACMMYLSIFPEDYVIAKDRLLYRWIVEGLVTEKRGLTLLEVAEEYFNELTSRNMIQLDRFEFRDNIFGKVELEGCRVHDMILEVMVSKSDESNFVSLVGRQYKGMSHGHGKVRRLSIHDNGHDKKHHVSYGIEAMKLQHVRSLTTFQRSYGLGKLLDRLGEFKLLRVLDLEDCWALQNKHMRDVCRLYLLRFLRLRGTNVNKMPDKVGDLEHLGTLDVKSTFIRELPRTVTKLSKLEHLRSEEWLLPQGLGNMQALCEVDMGVLTGDNVKVTHEIGELTKLQVLSIRIEDLYRRGEIKEEFWNALTSSLSRTCALRSLHVARQKGSLDFLNDITPPPLLQRLSVSGSISQLPGWISSLTHLTKFEVGQTELVGDQFFRVLCKLPNLESVQLEAVECKDGELVAHPEHNFPTLRILKVFGCSTRLSFEVGSMTKLEKIELLFEDKEEMCIVGVENLKNLKEVKLRGRKGNPAMECAAEQLKARSTVSKNIKVVADWYY